MKLQAINNNQTYNRNNYSQHRNKDITFQGYDMGLLLRRTILQPNQDKLWSQCSELSHISGLNTRKLISILSDATKRQFNFMDEIVQKYHGRNWFPLVKKEERENPQFILDIYNSVKKPNDIHSKVMMNSTMPMETLSNLYKAAPDKESLVFVDRMQTEVMDGSEEAAKRIISLLNLPYRDAIIKDFDTYKSFLILNKDSDNIANKLNKLISNNSFNRKKYDAKLGINKLANNHSQFDFINNNRTFLEENYSKERYNFMRNMTNEFLSFRKGLSDSDYKEILDMYSTTSSQNINIRISLMNKFRNSYPLNGESDISSLRKLFDAVDADKNIAEFVKKALNGKIKANSIQSILYAIELVPPKKLNTFHKNIIRIYENSNTQEELKNGLLKEVENPFYTTQTKQALLQESINAGFSKAQTRIQKLKLYAENQYNQLRYKFATRNSEDALIVLNKDVEQITKPSTEAESSIITSDHTRFMPKATSEAQNIETKPVKLVRTIKESPQARKLRVTSDINGIIEQKLGEKTLEKQKGNFAANATVMRFKLLNDIFDSISATRTQQKALGIRPTIQNRDAIKVFSRINGRNKKLVRYMLRQTNSNNERIYNIRDIVSLVDNAEKQIAKNKKANKSYKAADAKAYYENIYQSMVQEHGKLKRKRK